MPGRRRIGATVAAGWIAALGSAYFFCWPAVHGYGLVGTDIYRYFMPLHAFYHDELQAGRFPLWNPYLGFGVDVVAESQTGVFYLPNLVLYSLLDVGTAHNVSLVLHLVLASGFLFHYLRCCGLRPAAGIFGGFVFTYGFLLPRLGIEWSYVTGAWIPAVLLCHEQYLQGRGRRWLWACSAVFAIQLTAGHFQYAFTVLLMAMILTAVRRVPTRVADAAKRMGAVAVALSFAFLLAAAQTLPTWRLSAQSAPDGEWNARPDLGLTKLWYTPEIVFPWHYCYVDPNRALLPHDTAEAENHVFVGMLPIFFCLLAWFAKPRSKQLVGWMIIGLLGLFLAAGAWPIGGFFWEIPGFSFFHAPGRYYVMTALALAAGAGFGLEKLTDLKNVAVARKVGWLFVAPQLAMIAATLFVSLVPVWKQRLLELWLGWYGLPAQPGEEAALAGVPNPPAAFDLWLLGGGLACTAVCLVVWLVTKLKTNGRTILIVCLACGVVEYRWVTAGLIKDAWFVDWQADRMTSATFVSPHPMLFRKQSAVRQAVSGRIWAPDRNFAALLDVSVLPVYVALGPHQHFPDDVILNVPPEQLLTKYRKWLRLCGVRFILTDAPLPPSSDIAEVQEIHDWFLVGIWTGPESTFVSLHRLELSEADGVRKPPTRSFVVADLDSDSALQEASVAEQTPEGSKSDLVFEINSPVDGYFVLADLFDAGWKASVDGAKRPIHRYQQVFRAVPIAAGRSVVRLTYRPPALRMGLIISAIAWAGWAFGFVRLTLRGRQSS